MKSRSPKPDPPAEKGTALSAGLRHGSLPVVAIGASAGGLEAYSEFLKALPTDLGMAFVLVQHLDPTHHSLLGDIIAKATKMPVNEVRAGMKVLPNRVYVIPPASLIALNDGVFALTPRGKEPGHHLAVNFFMRSLAEERKEKAIGIVLSGTGADGTLGVMDIKTGGGITFAQEPVSARYDSMPRSAIASGCVDFVLPPKEIAKELQRITGHPFVRRGDVAPEVEPSPSAQQDFARIIEQLRRATGVDFSQYKPNTIQRRALRRMMILRLESTTEYVGYLKEHPEEAQKLHHDVLIPVTRFFRDFEAFEALKTAVYPAIIKDKGSKGTIRMWAPGCSTGEETYSLAMTLLEFLGDKASSFQVQIFGTDLNEKGIQHARTGVYRESIAEEISPERMRRFFVKVDEGYRVNKAVRDMCVFARQNLANDPPFSQMNMVACRNLLIYLAPTLQKKIIPTLHYALKPSGFLILGKSEGVSGFQNLFSTVDAKHKIYARKAISSRLHYDFSKIRFPGETGADTASETTQPQASRDSNIDVQMDADRLVLKHYSPVGVVINSAMEVVQFRGRTTPYLEPPPGKPSLNVLKLARQALAADLHALISRCKKKGVALRKEGIPFAANGDRRILNISVAPLGGKITSATDRHYLVLFEDVTSRSMARPESVPRGKGETAKAATTELKRVRKELADTQDALRAAIESEEATKEEFQSANEEILSGNEELQSTNEELETSKEELQSVNEELNTLNDELRNSNTELHDVNNDLLNFLNSTRIPIVMLDRHSRIRRFTPNAASLFKVVASDIGRPISDLKLRLKPFDLEMIIAKVLDALQPVEREVQDLDDHWWSLHVLPYRTYENNIDGTVLALQDVHGIRIANEQLAKSTEFFRSIINTVREPLLILDSELRVIAANEPYLHTFGVSSAETVNKFVYRLGNEQWNIPKLRVLLEEVLPQEKVVTDFQLEHDFPSLGRRTMLINARTLVQATGQHAMILLAIEDITERELAEAALITSEKLAASGRLAASLAHEINNPLQAITNLMTLLGHSSMLNPQDREYATLAAKELERVVHLVRLSLGFYREPSVPTALDLGNVLDSILNLYANQIEAKRIKVTKQYPLDSTVSGYPGDIRQIFSTLLVNALEANGEGGHITVRASTAFNRKNREIHGVRIVVADDGAGIPARSIAHIFEPFFTTKGERGTGIGLWVTRGIVDRLGGSIRVRSRTEPGRSGTCFSIFLPEQGQKAV